jgi:hypothetical protein
MGLKGLEFRNSVPDLVEIGPKFVDALVRGQALRRDFGAGMRLTERQVQFLAE